MKERRKAHLFTRVPLPVPPVALSKNLWTISNGSGLSISETVNVFTLFRISVVTPIVLSVLGVAYSFLAEPSFSENWKNLIEWSGDGSVFPEDASATSPWIWLLIGFLGLLAIVTLINQVFLFFYWKPSRGIYLAGCILSYLSTLLFGLNVLPPVEYLLYEVATFVSGITLALAYFSPVAERFK